MMKRKFLAVVLPIIGCATVVGSGFSAWYFGETTGASDSKSFGVNIGITEEVNAAKGALTINGNVKKFEGYYLILDQGGAKNLTNTDSGIMFYQNVDEPVNLPDKVTKTSDNIWNFDIDYSGSLKTDNKTKTTIKDLYAAGLQIRFEISISYSVTLYNYLHVKNEHDSDPATIVIKSERDTSVGNTDEDNTKLKFGEADVSDSTVTYTAEHVVSGENLDEDAVNYDFTLDMNTDENFVNALFKYNNKPGESDELKNMKEQIADEKITFTVKALIENTGAHLEKVGA